MDRSETRMIQRKLAEMGHYNGDIDGLRGPNTHAAVRKGISQLGQTIPSEFPSWSGKRQSIAFLQAYCHAEGIDSGDIDGFWGPQTDFAAEALEEKLETGTVWNWQDEGPSGTQNPHTFPDETRAQTELVNFYGPPGKKGGARPGYLVKVPLPWKMKLAWNKNQSRSFLWAHEKIAGPLKNVLARVDGLYNDAQKADLGIDIFSGDYNPRLMSGASRASLHSWGIAYDFDDQRNRLKWNRSQARLGQKDAVPFWEAWEAEGFCSLGRIRNFDFMHVQAAHRTY